MAVDKVWIGGTSTDPLTEANWDPGTDVANDDNLIFNDQATQSCGGGVMAFTGVTIHVESNFRAAFTIGSFGNPFQLTSIAHLKFQAPSEDTSYIKSTGVTDLCIVDSGGGANPALIFDGSVKNIVVPSGRLELATGAVLTERADVYGARGGQTSLLTIPTGVTLTGSKIHVMGGFADISSDVPEVFVSDGEVVLSGIADITTALEMKGGQFWWDAQGEIKLAEVHGGMMAIRLARITRVLTTGVLGGDGNMDFRIGGLKDSLFTNGVLEIGENAVMWPRGTYLTPSMDSQAAAR